MLLKLYPFTEDHSSASTAVSAQKNIITSRKYECVYINKFNLTFAPSDWKIGIIANCWTVGPQWHRRILWKQWGWRRIYQPFKYV